MKLPRKHHIALAILAGGIACLAVTKGFPHIATPDAVEIVRGPANLPEVSLTFDAGGEATGLLQLLDELDHGKVKTTFFITGRWASEHPELVREICRRGHELGNHTWSHPDLTRLPNEKIKEEIVRAEDLLSQISGRTPQPLFRAPYGARNERVLRLIGGLGYRSIYWTLDSLDSDAPPKSEKFLTDRVCRPSNADLNGAIILMHVGEPATVAAVPAIVSNLQGRGLKFVSVSNLLKERLP
jgi:peptidoglycan/xylan/chitin deacetylase (PgdA/CDA1 family)